MVSALHQEETTHLSRADKPECGAKPTPGAWARAYPSPSRTRWGSWFQFHLHFFILTWTHIWTVLLEIKHNQFSQKHTSMVVQHAGTQMKCILFVSAYLEEKALLKVFLLAAPSVYTHISGMLFGHGNGAFSSSRSLPSDKTKNT